jgi:flagellar biosynthesis GTPase FlhF
LKLAIWRLGRLSESELVRANNIAHNKELLANLGLNKTFEEAMGLPTTRAARKSGQKSGGKGGRGKKAKRARVEGERTSSDEEEEEDEEEESGNEEVQEPPATREKRAKPTPKAAAPKEWAKKAKALLEEGDSGLLWSELVEQWWLREQGKGFISPVSSVFLWVGGVGFFKKH